MYPYGTIAAVRQFSQIRECGCFARRSRDPAACLSGGRLSRGQSGPATSVTIGGKGYRDMREYKFKGSHFYDPIPQTSAELLLDQPDGIPTFKVTERPAERGVTPRRRRQN